MTLARLQDTPQHPVASHRCLHELLTRQAMLTPEVVAVAEGTYALTYRGLEEQANQLAHVLRALGVGPETVVGLAIQPGRNQVEALVALCAILKAGGAVLTLSRFYPPATLRGMMAEVQAALIVAVSSDEGQRMQEITGKHKHVVCLDDPVTQQRVAAQPSTPPTSQVTVNNLAYVIYTSGSTGTPKGVLCEHVHLVPLGQAQGVRYHVSVEDRIGHAFSWQFDGIWSVIATALANGATLCLPEHGVFDNGANTVAWIERECITLMFCTPSSLASWPEITLPAHPALVVAGESCPEDLAKRYAARCRFYTAYGPAEAGICLTTGLYGGQGTPTLGNPLPYVRLALLDAEGQPVPPGQEGEVVVEYPQARGYATPQETAKRFRGGRYYTGDHATQLPDGALLFAGRTDAQVKLPGGVLCNLEQIEQLLGAQQSIRACKVLWREQIGVLVLYVVPKERGQLSSRTLRTYLSEWLPDAIVSRCLSVELDALPLTPNGKADPHPDHYPLPTSLHVAGFIGEFRPPSTATEIQLAEAIARLISSPFAHPVPASEVNVLQTLDEHGVDSLTLGVLEVEMAQRWQRDLTPAELRLPIYEIAQLLDGGPAPFPTWEEQQI